MALARWEPFNDLLSMRQMVNQLFDHRQGWQTPYWQPSAAQTPLDFYTDGEGYFVEVALPGVRPEDIEVELVGRTLTIRGELKLEQPANRQYFVRQRQGGRFETAVTLPDAADAEKIQASFEHGVLRLAVPKSEAARPRKIELKAGS